MSQSLSDQRIENYCKRWISSAAYNGCCITSTENIDPPGHWRAGLKIRGVLPLTSEGHIQVIENNCFCLFAAIGTIFHSVYFKKVRNFLWINSNRQLRLWFSVHHSLKHFPNGRNVLMWLDSPVPCCTRSCVILEPCEFVLKILSMYFICC